MSTTKYLKLKAKKPIGGFVFLSVQQLCLVWWAYRIRLIQLRDFRVWFAAQEMGARRCQLDPGQVPEYTLKAHSIGFSGKRMGGGCWEQLNP